MKTKLFIFFLLWAFVGATAPNIIGDWKGTLEVHGAKLPLIFHFMEKEKQLVATMDSPMQGANGIPLDQVVLKNDSVKIKATALGMEFRGVFHDDNIEGIFYQAGMEFPLLLVRQKLSEKKASVRPQTPRPPFPYETVNVVVKNTQQGNLLAGTLCTPSKSKDIPVVIMISGSGAQNRDEELFNHKPFAVLADYLAKKGIGSLRMDDRGIGKSEVGKPNPTTADFSTDIASAITFLTEKGYKNIGLLGHSEGGIIAPMVASKDKRVRFLILLAAPGIPISELMMLQNYALGKAYGLPKSILEQNVSLNLAMYNFIQNYDDGNFEHDLKQFMTALFGRMYANKLAKEKIESLVIKQQKVIGSAWFRYFIKLDSQEYLKQIKVPILALNGSLDLQVTPKENLQGIRKALKKGANQLSTVKEYNGLNHLFQHAKTGLPLEYGQLTETISSEVLEDITIWIQKNAKP